MRVPGEERGKIIFGILNAWQERVYDVCVRVPPFPQGIDFHRPLKTTPPLEAVHKLVRSVVPRYGVSWQFVDLTCGVLSSKIHCSWLYMYMHVYMCVCVCAPFTCPTLTHTTKR